MKHILGRFLLTKSVIKGKQINFEKYVLQKVLTDLNLAEQSENYIPNDNNFS